jgi:hypothetical protein
MKFFEYIKSNRLRILQTLTIIAGIFFAYAVYRNMQNSLWRDEGATASLINRNFTEIIKLAATDNTPPLHAILLHYITEIFGRTEFTLRLLSLLSMIGSLFLLRKLSKNKFSKEIISILFLSSFHTYLYATEARTYGLFMFLTLLSFVGTNSLISQIKAKDSVFSNGFKQLIKNKSILFFVLSNILVIYSNTLGLFVTFTNALIVLYIARRNHLLTKQLFIKLVTIGGFILISYLPWLLIIFTQLSNLQKNGFWLTFDPVKSLIQTIFSYFYAQGWRIDYPEFWSTLFFSIYFILFIFGTFKFYKAKKYKYLIAFFVPFVLVYLISFKQPLMYIRYVLFLLPFVLIIAANGLSHTKKVLSLALIIFILIFNITIFRDFYNKDTKPPHRPLSEFIKQNTDSSFVIMNDNEYSFFECEFYLGNCFIVKDYDSINKSVGIALIDKSKAMSEEQASQNDHIVMIFWNDGYPNYDFLKNYRIVKEERLKTDSDRLNAVIYEKI